MQRRHTLLLAFLAVGSPLSAELIDLGVEHGLIDKAGSWYSYGEDRIGQGKENVRSFLRENPDIARHVETQIRAALIPEEEKAEDKSDAKSVDSDA